MARATNIIWTTTGPRTVSITTPREFLFLAITTAALAAPLADRSFNKDILGGKTYFFANYEGFRWPNSETISRNVPTASMRLGLLFFGGQYYNLNPTPVTFHGVTYAGTTLDPRGIGVNTTVAANVVDDSAAESLPDATAIRFATIHPLAAMWASSPATCKFHRAATLAWLAWITILEPSGTS